MDQNLREYIQQNDKEQKKCLGLYKTGVKIRRSGLTGFYITDWEPSFFLEDEKTAKGWKQLKFCVHLICLAAAFFATENLTMVLAIYVVIHIALIATGQYIRETNRKKLEQIGGECQGMLDSFRQEQYQENGIIRGTTSDVVRFDHNFAITSGFFEGDMTTSCQPMLIGTSWFDYAEGTEDYVDMKNNIASVEFNKKFHIYVPEEKKADCMKFLTPTRQVAMIRSDAFEDMDSILISQGRIHAETNVDFERPNEIIDPFSFSSILTLFEEAEKYCRETRECAEKFYNSYLKMNEMIGA